MALWNNDFTKDLLFLSVDAILGVVFLKNYNRFSTYYHSIQEVSAKQKLLEDEVGDTKNCRYVMIEGSVKALKNPIPSRYVSNVNGVVQRLSTKELVSKRSSSGFWWDESRLINQSYNTVPFAIVVDKYLVEVKDVLVADELCLETVYDKYTSTMYTLSGNLWSYFFGLRQNGVKITEEMLKEGTVVTCIGDLLTTPDGSKSLVPPSKGKPFIITTQPVVKFLESTRTSKIIFGTLLCVTGCLAVLFCGRLAYNLYSSIKKRRDKENLKRQLEENRKLRRQRVRQNDDLPDSLRCVVCQDNPKEVIMLPCGHLCACEDCSERLGSLCPICRSEVLAKNAAFLS